MSLIKLPTISPTDRGICCFVHCLCCVCVCVCYSPGRNKQIVQEFEQHRMSSVQSRLAALWDTCKLLFFCGPCANTVMKFNYLALFDLVFPPRCQWSARNKAPLQLSYLSIGACELTVQDNFVNLRFNKPLLMAWGKYARV